MALAANLLLCTALGGKQYQTNCNSEKAKALKAKQNRRRGALSLEAKPASGVTHAITILTTVLLDNFFLVFKRSAMEYNFGPALTALFVIGMLAGVVFLSVFWFLMQHLTWAWH